MKNYEAEKLKKIIKAKELAMIIQVQETDTIRRERNKIKIEHARLVGEFIGMIDALHWWMMPEELLIKLENKKKELIEKYDTN